MMQVKNLMALMLAVALTAGPVQAQTRDGSDASGSGSGQAAGQSSGDGGESSDEGGKKIYRVRDEQGNVVFTDEPPEGSDAEEVELKKGNSMSLESAPGVELPDEKKEEKAVQYQVKLVSPAHEQTFQHPTEPIPIKYTVKPQLRDKHSVQVLHNGKPLDKPELDWPVRGEHSIQVRVVDADGETVVQSDTHTLYVHRPSQQLP